ncbi:MAG: Cas9 inhibitor AcrIIA9 family protein [Clostridiales bacterium]
MENLQEAIKKINDEMQKTPENTYTEVIGHYIIDHITNVNAEHVLDKDKTLNQLLSNITATAKKQAKNNIAVLADAEVFAMVDDYFGLGVVADAKIGPIGININFDDFI